MPEISEADTCSSGLPDSIVSTQHQLVTQTCFWLIMFIPCSVLNRSHLSCQPWPQKLTTTPFGSSLKPTKKTMMITVWMGPMKIFHWWQDSFRITGWNPAGPWSRIRIENSVHCLLIELNSRPRVTLLEDSG